jgi:cyclophilin family peptidyl-prolyl cis-trans isomerase
MLRFLCVAGLAAALALTSVPSSNAQAKKPASPVVVLETAKGVIEIETLPADSPKSVERFLELARKAFYRQHRFHWVQSNLIQVGDPLSRDMTKMEKWGTGGSGPKFAPRPLGVAETSKRPFARGLVGLAYVTGARPESADSQFFILKTASSNLDGKYALIGRVTTGMNVVDKIERLDIIKSVSVKEP